MEDKKMHYFSNVFDKQLYMFRKELLPIIIRSLLVMLTLWQTVNVTSMTDTCCYHFLPGAELSLAESFGLLNDLFPFHSILDAGYPIFLSSFVRCPV
jgi:hypothetical protein